MPPLLRAVHERETLLGRLLPFADDLRQSGVAVSPAAVVRFVEAALLLAPAGLYWAGRATLATSRDAIAVYDRVYLRHFSTDEVTARPRRDDPARVVDAAGDEVERGAHASSGESRADADLATLSEDELADARERAVRALRAMPWRRSRRRRGAPTGVVELRRTVRAECRPGPLRTPGLVRVRRRLRRRRLVVVLDVSRSMASHTSVLLAVAHALRGLWTPTNVYCFSTRLTSLDGVLSRPAVDDAIAAVVAEAPDTGGGTRIGAALQTLVEARGGRHARGAVVLIVSDGLERGDPAALERAMATLSRRASRVVWASPLADAEGYRPVQRGMRAALPHVDELVSVRSSRRVDELAAVLRDALS